MNFDLSEEQALFKDTAERFAGDLDSLARRRLRDRDGGYDLARWREAASLGLIALGADEAAGGLAGSPIDLATLAEALGKAIAPDPWLELGMMPTLLLSAAGRSDLVSGVIAGDSIVAAALAERQARFSLIPRQTRARAEGARHVLNGEKTFVLGGMLADRLIVSAELDGTCAFYLVPADRSGVARHPYRLVDGSHACEVRLIEVEVSAEERLEIDAVALTGVVADLRLLAAAEMLGLAQRLFDDTLDYVKQRHQFGVAIGTFQALQHRLVDCYGKLEQARSMLYRAALADRGDAAAWRKAAAGAKTFIGEIASHIAREAVQMHGGMGITEELAIGHGMKRVLLLGALFGDADATLVDYAVAA
jgi:alkylation response protein AidB-like acyl-CoA dehydrogenase